MKDSNKQLAVPAKRSAARRWTLIGSCMLILAAAGGIARTAHAYVPAGDLISAINFKNFVLKTNNFALWDWAFSNELAGPDGIAGPDGTPDGFGAFLFYTGSGGAPGAIYAFRDNGVVEAWAIYGGILASWSANGHETGPGYPTSDEFTAGSNELNWGCQSGDRAQWFWNFGTNQPWLACYHWPTGVTSWHLAID
jgi:hypothetical protein